MKIQSETQTRQCPGCGTVMEDQAVTWSNVQVELVSDSAIRADERAKCRAELLAKVDEVERIARDDYGSALDELYDFAKEAFGGE
jgi:hypothetical protein